MRIAITTWHNGPNCGTFLQCFGLYQYLTMRGHYVILIDYRHNSKDFIKRGLKYYLNNPLGLLKRKIVDWRKKKKEIVLQSPFKDLILERDKRMALQWQNIPITKIVSTAEEFEALNKDFDVFIAGSDQIWNPTMLNRSYMLDYVHNDKIKAAYGPSIGIGTILPEQRKVYKKYLTTFDFIGVRERMLFNVLKEELPQKNLMHVLDPSMLYPKDLYLEMARLPDGIHAGKYVLCYFSMNNEFEESIVRSYALEYNLKIVVMAMFGKSWCVHDATILCVDPQEFIGLIANAAVVFTSSFHCTIFSIMFHKELFVFESKQPSKSADTNQRYIEQLDNYGIERRYIRYGQALNNDILEPIDYMKVEKIFQHRLLDSKAFINQFC